MYYYVINPAAGRGASRNIQDRLRQRLTELGIAGEFAKTTGPGDATKLAKLAIEKGYNTVVAVGGDETVNEVINGVAGAPNMAIGIIPTGSSNILAERLGIHNWQQACDTLASRRLTSFGLIAAGQSFFLSTLTLGFETDLDKQIDTTPSGGLRSKVSRFRESWGHAQNFQTLESNIKVDDTYQLDCPIFTLSVANQKFLNPAADNKLVVSLSDRPSKAKLTAYIWSLLGRGEPLEDAATTRFYADRLVIDTKPSTGIMVDGKLAGRTPIAIRLTDRRIRFITAKPATGLAAEH